MFNGTNYSLADIAAATRDNDFNDNNMWWIIVLFLFGYGGFGGYGYRGGMFGANCGCPTTASGITDGYVLTSDFASLERKMDGITNGLADGFYAMNTGMLNGFSGVKETITQDMIANMNNTNALTAQITALNNQVANCCCQNRYEAATNFANLNYNLADQSCQTRQAIGNGVRDIIENQDANTKAIIDFLTKDKIATLTAENQNLKFAASQQAQNAYLLSELKPHYTGCGCGCTMG